jgi:hypothetical protein
MTVMLTGALASDWAAFRPPKPAPTITTRCAGLPSILLPIIFLLIVFLLIRLLLYKIQRDGKRVQEFGGGLASGVVGVGPPVSG